MKNSSNATRAQYSRFCAAAAASRNQGYRRGDAARAVARAPAHRPCRPPRSAHARAVHGHPAQPDADDPRTAADEPVRHTRPLHPGVRPHCRPDAARPLPRLHGRRAHPEGGAQRAALRSARTRARVSVVQPADERIRHARNCSTLPGCSTTSPRDAAAITPKLGKADAHRFCKAHGLRAGRLRPGGLAGGAASGDVGHCAETGSDRSRCRARVRPARRRRTPPHRALSADGRRHPRHQPEGVECLESQAA